MVRWCMEEEVDEVEKEEKEELGVEDKYKEEEEEINAIEDNGPLLDARLLWDSL